MTALDAHSVAAALGGEASGDTVLAPGPGHSAADRSLSIKLGDYPDGYLCHSHAGDEPLLCRDYIREKCNLPPFKPGIKRGGPSRGPHRADGERVRSGQSDEERTKRAMKLWGEARPIAGTLAARYLAGRGIALTDDVLAADALRYHPACPFGRDHRYPAMIGLMRDIRSNEPVAVHRTAILPDGSGKATPADGGKAKRMLGPARGAAIKLIADDAVTLGLGLAEGIETSLTMLGIGWAPVWAAGSTGAIKQFPVLAGIECLTIFADADDGGTGIADARTCAARWRDAGAEAAVIAPHGGDWNDVGRAA